MRETRLLAHVTRAASRPAQVVIPPGDDLAAVRSPDPLVLAGVDQVVAGVHFDPDRTPAAAIGWKAVARCVSDVAAMAGRPWGSLCAALLPAEMTEDEAEALFDAVRDAADRLGAPLVGGDIAIHRTAGGPLVLSVTVLASPGPAGPIRRSGARPGDRILVTGRLGGSLEPGGGGRHLEVHPRVETALALAELAGPGLRAMIDLSDGLGRDAGRLAAASEVDLELVASKLPLHAGSDWRGAVGDGEDYEILAAVDPAVTVPSELAGVAITEIGQAVAPERNTQGGAVRLSVEGRVERIEGEGWDHHSSDGGAAP